MVGAAVEGPAVHMVGPAVEGAAVVGAAVEGAVVVGVAVVGATVVGAAVLVGAVVDVAMIMRRARGWGSIRVIRGVWCGKSQRRATGRPTTHARASSY